MNILLTADMFEILFKDFIEKSAIRNEHGLDMRGPNNDPCFELYWDRNDALSSDTITELIEDVKEQKEVDFICALTNYIYENWYDSIDDDYNDAKYDTLRDFAEYYDLDYNELSATFDVTIDETWQDTVYFDLNLETLLRHSYPEDLTLYFGTYWDDEAYAMNEWVEEKPRITYLRKSPLAWLARTQGYSIKDIFENKESVFCKRVREELFSYRTDLDGMQLIAVPNSNNWDAITDLAIHKEGVIKAGTMFGLFNRNNGSGCGLNIITEKDIKISPKSPLHEVSIKEAHRWLDYSPKAVYGSFSRPDGEQLETVQRK
jgi:hypothetical protein